MAELRKRGNGTWEICSIPILGFEDSYWPVQRSQLSIGSSRHFHGVSKVTTTLRTLACTLTTTVYLEQSLLKADQKVPDPMRTGSTRQMIIGIKFLGTPLGATEHSCRTRFTPRPVCSHNSACRSQFAARSPRLPRARDA
jgi:hypothetical protein